jgi:hypothetical protein
MIISYKRLRSQGQTDKNIDGRNDKNCSPSFRFVSFRFVVLTSSTYLFTAGVEIVLFALDHTQTHITVGRTPLDEGSARHRDLYLTTQKHSHETNIHALVGLEPTIPASAQPQIHALDRTAAGIGGVALLRIRIGILI